MARKAVYQTKYNNKAAIYIVFCILIVIAAILCFNCYTLKEKKSDLEAQKAYCEELLNAEQEETLELEELEKTTKTKKYYEQVAREKLGMVYEDEIIFKEEN